MSIVERAIRKLQESRARAPAASVVPVAELARMPVNAVAAVAAAVAEVAPPPPARVIPFDLPQLRSHRLMPPESQERELAGQYRQIKRQLVARALGRGHDRVWRGNALMVASALPGEGKSFTSVNLALSIALEQDIEVLLVDADVAKPRLTREFGLTADKGLLDALSDETIDVESLVIGTDIPSLMLLPSGTPSSTATELLASPQMEPLLERLCGPPSRIVIFDSPPLLPTTEARVLAPAMGQVVLVVRAGSTPQQAVQEALRLIGERNQVSLVLTHSEGDSAGSYYYSSHGYGTYGDAVA